MLFSSSTCHKPSAAAHLAPPDPITRAIDFCFELFYARVGYEFDLAAGLRLPVQVEVEGLPDDILASVQDEIQTSLTPLDFTAADYTAFCEHHDLDSAWYISNCTDRFAFPDALNAEDGDELVAYYEVFAGIVVRVLGIPLINWAIDSAMDLPAACTMWKILGLTDASIMEMLELLSDPGGAYETLKDQGVVCGSITTPFGHDNGKLRTFLFASYSFDVRADCLEAMARGEVIKLDSKTVPLCTNMILGVSGLNASGKGEVVAFLTQRSFYAHSLSDVIRMRPRWKVQGPRG